MSVLEDKKEFTFIWKIENFSMLPHQKGDQLKSPEFIVDMWKGIKWNLELFPRGRMDSRDDHVGYFLNTTATEKDFEVNFSLTLESTEPTKEIIRKADYPLQQSAWGWLNFCSLTEIYAKKHLYLPQDILSLRCQFRAKDSNDEELTEENKTECATYFLKKEHISQTSIQVQQMSITWPIQNLSTRRERIETSFTALMKDLPGLKVTLNFNEIANSVCVPIEIQQIYPDPLVEKKERLFVKCKITVVSVDKEHRDAKESTHLFKLAHNDVWHFPPFIKSSNLTRGKYLNQKDTLLLQCQFVFSCKSGIIHWDDSCAPFSFGPRKKDKKTTWSTSVQNLCASGKFSDIELKAGGEIFPAHKLVLCARSSVFSAMFENDMKEKISGVVEIEDVDPPTLKRMLTFITFDGLKEIDLSNEDVCKLYEAADKYNIESLMDWCTIYFTSLSVESVYNVLVLADTHQDNLLMTSARNFICCHETEIFDSPHWKSFMDSNIKLAAEIMHELIVNRNRIGNN